MSLTLITAMTSLRVLVGVVGVGYSLYANKDEKGQFEIGKIPEAILGETVGGLFADWLKEGRDAGYDKFLERLDTTDPDAINHDIQKAARKAALLATHIACQVCLSDLTSERHSIWSRVTDIAWKSEEINWLAAVSKSIKYELEGIETAQFDEQLDYKELFSIFDKDNIANSAEEQKKQADKLRAQTLEDIRRKSYAKFGGQINVPFSPAAFELLREAVLNGWEVFPQDQEYTIQLKLTAGGAQVRRYDWFHLVCVIFNEEYKINEKIEAALQKQTALEQTALLKKISGDLQAFGKIENFDELKQQISEFSEENFRFHKITHEKQDKAQKSLDDIEDKLKDVEILPKQLPRLVGRLIEKTLFVDRFDEQKNLIQWLTQKSKKVIVIKAASGYGKTSLAMEVLHSLALDQHTVDDRLDALLVFLCRDGEGDFREVCKKTDERLGIKKDSFVSRYDEFVREKQLLPDILPDELIREVVNALAKLGNVWLVFDNFETALFHNQIKEKHLHAFIEKALQTTGLHFLLTSQKSPVFQSRAEIETVEINELPVEYALEFLRTEGGKLKSLQIDCGLAETTYEDLQKLKEMGFSFLPMALVALVGYIEASYQKYGQTMAKVVEDQQLFVKFREHDAKAGSMSLIEKQYLALSADERLVLKAVSVFSQAVEFPVLVKVLAENLDEDTIFRVLTSNTLIRRIGANFYELLPQAATVVSNQTDKADEKLTLQELHFNAAIQYMSICRHIFECYTPEQIAPYLLAADHFYFAGKYKEVGDVFDDDVVYKLNALGYMREIIKRCHLIEGKLGDPELEADNFMVLGTALGALNKLQESVHVFDRAITIFDQLISEEEVNNDTVDDLTRLTFKLGSVLMNKAVSNLNLKNLNESIDESDKAIEIFGKLIDQENRWELSNQLGLAFMNKGAALVYLNRLDESIIELDKATRIFEKLINEEGRLELANQLGMTLMNKGTALLSLSRLEESIVESNRAIGVLEKLIYEDRRLELTSQLGMTLMNKGAALLYISRLEESIVELNKAIEIFEKLINEEGRTELTNYLGMALMNKGAAFVYLRKLEDSIIELDKATRIFKKLINEEGRTELVSQLGLATLNKGLALLYLNRLEESIVESNRAIGVLEKLINEGGHTELANYLGLASINKGAALLYLNKLEESVVESDKAIEIFEKLINEEGRTELTNYLGMALMNKGAALMDINRENEAIIALNKATKIFEKLINEEGRVELLSELGAILLNKGAVLLNLSQFEESITESDGAIEIYEYLIDEQGRIESLTHLGMALMNKGLAFEELAEFENALIYFDKSHERQEYCLSIGQNQILPNYLKNLANRVRVLIKLEDWQRTASDALNVLQHLVLLDDPQTPEFLVQQIAGNAYIIISNIKGVSPENREKIYKNAGADGEAIRQLVDTSDNG